MDGKVCTKCEEFKPYEEFAKDSRDKKRGGSGYQSKCKECNKKFRKENKAKVNESIDKSKAKRPEHYKGIKARWYQNNLEVVKERHKKAYLNNREYFIKKTAKWRKENPEEFKEQNRLYKEKNPERIKNWRKENEVHVRRYTKEYYNKNAETIKKKAREFAKTDRGREISYQARIKRKSHKHKTIFTSHERKQILDRDNWRCQNCGIKVHDKNKGNWNTPDKAHIDHIIPLTKGGNSEPSNLQVLCRTCNLKKQDKIELQLALF